MATKLGPQREHTCSSYTLKTAIDSLSLSRSCGELTSGLPCVELWLFASGATSLVTKAFSKFWTTVSLCLAMRRAQALHLTNVPSRKEAGATPTRKEMASAEQRSGRASVREEDRCRPLKTIPTAQTFFSMTLRRCVMQRRLRLSAADGFVHGDRVLEVQIPQGAQAMTTVYKVTAMVTATEVVKPATATTPSLSLSVKLCARVVAARSVWRSC